MIDLSRRSSLTAMLAFSAVGPAAGGAKAAAIASARSVGDFGAVGDGRTDDTEAFRLALNSAACVLVPPTAAGYRVTRTLALQRPGQSIIGFGALSRILLDPTDAKQGNLLVTQVEDSTFIGLHLVPATTTASLFDGWGIAVVGTRRAVIENCHFSGMRRGGVMLSDSDECAVEGNVFVESVVKLREAQATTGYDVFVAGSSSYNVVRDNRCLSGVGVAIGCQTAESGKSQRGNVIRGNLIRGYPAYGIMVYLSDPKDRIDAITIEGNVIEGVSGSIRTDGRTTFYGCGIYLQTTNDAMVIGNRIVNTNTDRSQPFSGSAVPAAIGLSGYGNAIVSGNMIEGCHHGIASIQVTAQPRHGDTTVIADNIVRECRGAGVWLPDATAAIVHDNRLTATEEGGTHGIFVKHFKSQWMDRFSIHDNDVSDFTVGIEVSGDGVGAADISGNRVRNNQGNGIYSAAATSSIQRNQISGTFGIAIGKAARTGMCRDNILNAGQLAIIDDLGSGVRVQDNIVLSGSFSSSIAVQLPPGPAPSVTAKRWWRKTEASTIEELNGGYEGQTVSIVADAAFRVRHGGGIRLATAADTMVEPGSVISFAKIESSWRQLD